MCYYTWTFKGVSYLEIPRQCRGFQPGDPDLKVIYIASSFPYFECEVLRNPPEPARFGCFDLPCVAGLFSDLRSLFQGCQSAPMTGESFELRVNMGWFKGPSSIQNTNWGGGGSGRFWTCLRTGNRPFKMMLEYPQN